MRHLRDKWLFVIIVIYFFITIKLITNNATLYANIVNPLFWGSILIYLIYYINKDHIRFCINKKYYIYIIIISSINIVTYFYMGFIFGFSKSPYSHSIISIIENLIINIIPVASIELTRAIFVNRNNNKLVLIGITILLILVEINYNVLLDLLSNREKLFEYIFSDILRIITTSILCSYLSTKGSYVLSLIYRLSYECSILFLPILPAINWFIAGSINILSPIIIYILFKYRFVKQRNNIKRLRKNFWEKTNYILVLVLSIVLICFMLGMFKHESIVILSNSMSPVFYRGDVVIFKKLTDSELRQISKNTIIVYSMDEQNIVHRVINVIKENETVLYQTKGDYNNMPDPNLVRMDQIKGIYVFHIKYIGYPSVWLNSYFYEKDAEAEIS